ncbi:MAG: AAA family ATPase [Kiritimatiellae bacterium]|nr:AAA family ATPase [Kiritimatiellia bacterium]
MESILDKPTPVKKPLPVGNSDWSAVRAGYWSADKTQLISGLLDRKATVALFTRPRRFGKTFAIRMLRTFFEKTPESNAHLFEGTRVWADPAHRAEQGKYPVISITFKDAKGADWAATKAFMATAIGKEFRRHRAAFSSPDADPDLAEQARTVAAEKADDEALANSLGMLAEILHAVHKERPVILIDEYDSPINWAATHGFGEEALQFFRNFLSGAMKDGEHCRLGVITGILRVAKEGVLSGLNNIKVYSVFEKDFSDCFGLTEDEVRALLTAYGHSEKMDEAKAWYDGYLFGGREIYNPWSLLNYVDDGFTPKPYWTNTSSNDLVADVLSRMTPKMRDSLADFFENGECLVPCPGDLGPYGTIQNEPQRIWPLLVHTGYLKVLAGPDDNDQAKLAFPNRELRRVFRNEVLGPMNRVPAVGDDLQDILASLTSGDPEKFRKSVEAFLVSSASYFDMAHEDFFHGLVLGLLAIGRECFEIKSNREEGDGRPDIAMRPRPGVTLPGVILEFKAPKVPPRASQKRIEALLAAAAREARDQIDEKRYAAEMEAAGLRVLKYGVAFLGKRVALAK